MTYVFQLKCCLDYNEKHLFFILIVPLIFPFVNSADLSIVFCVRACRFLLCVRACRFPFLAALPFA
jgi:hypothetical protein